MGEASGRLYIDVRLPRGGACRVEADGQSRSTGAVAE
jgi:hypothetical protein